MIKKTNGLPNEIFLRATYINCFYEENIEYEGEECADNENEKYIGEKKNNERDGYGIYYYLNGYKYKGEWKNNKMEGYGVYYFPDGNRYEGQFKNDVREGYGVFLLF